MNKKFIIVLGVILSILIILGIVVIISVYKGKGELSIAKNNEIILNENLKSTENLAENDNVSQETEQEITREDNQEETTENTFIENTQEKENVDNNVKQNTNVEKNDDSKETAITPKIETKENTQKQTSVEQATTNKDVKVVVENNPTQTQPTPITSNDLTCSNGKHYMEVGNVDKWFNTKEEAIAFYNNEINSWADKLSSNEISSEEYYQKCPSGYEVWSCLCGKWTINYYYR